MSCDATIFHIALDADIIEFQSSGSYRCSSLEFEGFIHCCERHQLSGVVNRYYLGIDHLQLMLLIPDRLIKPLILENTVGGSELFPHIYGPINKEAIDSILPFGLNSSERTGLSL